MKIHNDIIQHSDEWFAIRRGKFTASNFAKLFMAKTTAGYQDAINQVVFERLTGESPESFSNNWMDRGTELEPIAIEQYETSTFNKVHRIGFVEATEWIGCSPDGFVSDVGMLQVKCPKYSTLITYHLKNEVPKDYMIQIQGELLVCEKEWSDFYVYHPKLKPLLKRIYMDKAMIMDINKNLNEAIEEVQKRIEKIR